MLNLCSFRVRIRTKDWETCWQGCYFRVTFFNWFFDVGFSWRGWTWREFPWVRGCHSLKLHLLGIFEFLLFGFAGFTVEVKYTVFLLCFLRELRLRQICVISSGWILCVGFHISPFINCYCLIFIWSKKWTWVSFPYNDEIYSSFFLG